MTSTETAAGMAARPGSKSAIVPWQWRPTSLRSKQISASKVVVVHPVLGRNTIAGILGLMTAHELRHTTQMARITRSAGFPPMSAQPIDSRTG